MKTVLLWLEGPLQSWGASSKFGRRETMPFPTLSGILGLLCCALGRGGEQRSFLAAMSTCRHTIVAYPRRIHARQACNPFQIDVGNRACSSPFLLDFHMVGSGYDTNDTWQALHTLRKADGGKPVGAGTKMTYRYYLQDMAFACAAEIPDMYLDEVERGLRAPVWPVCLGRRCCVPSTPIYAGSFSSEEAALEAAAGMADARGRAESFRVIPGADGEAMTLNDVPVTFGTFKQYKDRQVTVVPAQSEEA